LTHNSRQLWQEVCSLLKHHSKGASCDFTLNRLVRKVPQLQQRSDVPLLSEATVHVFKELWNTDQLAALLHDRHITEDPPGRTDPPVIILRWSASSYLIDGRARINHWIRTKSTEDHVALVIEPTN
jgi:hypothetical protein